MNNYEENITQNFRGI